MAILQSTLLEFHTRIKAEVDVLREKRDIIFEKICRELKSKNLPVPEIFNQGSYIYGVGIKPINGQDYDIDVGLIFDINPKIYDATTVRAWVLEILEDHTDRGIEEHGNCIRVLYKNDPSFHVDLVCYVRFSDANGNFIFQLAHKNNQWKNVDPVKLKEFIVNARQPFQETNDDGTGDQLQRVTRYLKRWNDLQIPGESPNKPSGLAILLLAIEQLKNQPHFNLTKNGSDDLSALITITSISKSMFPRIVILKPTPDYEDVFGKLDEEAMNQFKNQMGELHTTLVRIKDEKDNEVALIMLREFFGSDFGNNSDNDFVDKNSSVLFDKLKSAKQNFANSAKPWCIK